MNNQIVTTSVEIVQKEIENRIEEVLSKLYGIEATNSFRCVNPQHNDKNASMGLDLTGSKKRAHCFACNCHYSSIDLIQLKYPTLEYRDLIMKGCELLGIPFEANSSSFSSSTGLSSNSETEQSSLSITLRDNTSVNEFLQNHSDYSDVFEKCNQELLKSGKDLKYWTVTRGITLEILRRFNIGKRCYGACDTMFPPHYKYIIPFDSGYCQGMLDEEGRKNTTLGRYCKLKGRKQPLFNYNCLMAKPDTFIKIIFVTEGVLDALSVASVSEHEVVALCGVGLNTLKESIRHYCNAPKIVLVDGLDNDEAGNKAGKELKQLCQDEHWIYCDKKQYDYKDFNEFLTNDKHKFAEYIEQSYQEALVIADNADFYPVEYNMPKNEKSGKN